MRDHCADYSGRIRSRTPGVVNRHALRGHEFADPAPEDRRAYSGWTELVERIRCGTTDGMEELYALFSRGIRFYPVRQLGPQDLEDKIHDTFVVVVQAIRRGVREPSRLMGFVAPRPAAKSPRTSIGPARRRREQTELETTVSLSDPGISPEETAIFSERKMLIHKVLSEIPPRDREILTRFYLYEQSQDISAQRWTSPTPIPPFEIKG